MLPQRMKKAITDNPKKLANLIDLVNLSSTLREFVGQSQISRLGCFMRVWSYIKTNNLQVLTTPFCSNIFLIIVIFFLFQKKMKKKKLSSEGSYINLFRFSESYLFWFEEICPSWSMISHMLIIWYHSLYFILYMISEELNLWWFVNINLRELKEFIQKMKDDFEWETNLYDLLNQLSSQFCQFVCITFGNLLQCVCVRACTRLPLEAPQL